MTDLVLDGCRTTPLGSYLTALGLLRCVTRQFDPRATGWWEGRRFVLRSGFDSIEALVTALHERFEPEPIVSPWNAGSGFAGKKSSAKDCVDAIRVSDDPRLQTVREAIAAADRVVAEAELRGWRSSKPNEFWARKSDVLMLCRREFPDAAVAWLDAAAALGQDGDPAYSRILGTGGNFGRQDLSFTYLTRATDALTDTRSSDWLVALVTGDASVSHARGAVGQFDPARAGGAEGEPALVNPWAFLLTIEGALLFASAVTRRHGAETANVTLPFQVRGTTSGHTTAAAGETPLGELWAPEWTAPLTLADVTHLLAEGRAEWRGKPVGSGLDFVRAIASLGVDRGIEAFERHVFVDRLGQNPLAVPVGRIAVRERGGVELLGELDAWRRHLGPVQGAAVQQRLRAVEAAVFEHARTGAATDLVSLFGAIGRCHETVARSGGARQKAGPLVLSNGPGLLAALLPAAPDDRELRLALALATARDEPAQGGPHRSNEEVPRRPTLGGLRPLLSPVAETRTARWPVWSTATTPSLALGVARAVAEAARRRAFPGAVSETIDDLEPGVRGVRAAFTRGCRLGIDDLRAFVRGEVDDLRLADLLAGLLTVDWCGCPDAPLRPSAPSPHRPSPHRPSPELDALLPFLAPDPVDLPDESGVPRRVLLRPGSEWPVLLAAGRVDEVLRDARLRLRLAGVDAVVTARDGGLVDGATLAAALLLRPRHRDRLAALRRLTDLSAPSTPNSTIPVQEVSA